MRKALTYWNAATFGFILMTGILMLVGTNHSPVILIFTMILGNYIGINIGVKFDRWYQIKFLPEVKENENKESLR